MKPIVPTRSANRFLPILVVLAVAPLSAQVAPEPAKPEEVLILSPFTVQTSADVGYEASESLAGTGLKTKLTDLGASVFVITSKFLPYSSSNEDISKFL